MPNKLPFNIPINYKTIILGILAIIIIFLSILALIVPKNKQTTQKQTIKPTPITESTPAPAKKLPDEIQIKINQVDEKLKAGPEIEPPPIDENIGL